MATFTKKSKFMKNTQLPVTFFCKMIKNIITKHFHTPRMSPELVGTSEDLSSRSDHLRWTAGTIRQLVELHTRDRRK